MENGTTSTASLEAKIKTTAFPFLGDDFRSLDTESKICNIVYDKVLLIKINNILHYFFLDRDHDKNWWEFKRPPSSTHFQY